MSVDEAKVAALFAADYYRISNKYHLVACLPKGSPRSTSSASAIQTPYRREMERAEMFARSLVLGRYTPEIELTAEEEFYLFKELGGKRP